MERDRDACARRGTGDADVERLVDESRVGRNRHLQRLAIGAAGRDRNEAHEERERHAHDPDSTRLRDDPRVVHQFVTTIPTDRDTRFPRRSHAVTVRR